jgi:hypothetical protein
MKILLLPVAGQSARYPGMRPKWLLTMPNGKLMIEQSVSKINCKIFDKVYVIALKSHIDKYVNYKNLLKSLKKNISNKLEIFSLGKETSCQAETILEFLKRKKIKSSFLIKDCDNEFSIDEKVYKKKDIQNSVYAIDIKSLELIDAKSKSYLEKDEYDFITNIVEKKIISDFFCCGAYGFESPLEFKKNASLLLKKSKNVYISHIILNMILNGKNFKYLKGTDYVSWGTVDEYRNWQKKSLTIFCDFDGCLVKNGSSIFRDSQKIIPLEKNLIALKKIQQKNFVELIITTSRPKNELNKIKFLLDRYEIKYREIITGLKHARRILVNDFARTNPYPSSISINIERNSEELSGIFENLK